MPVKIYGTGGGKNTKDATALPDDVRAGKTFYNANGKQEGIWTPKVTDYTGDADAVPSDVTSGKIFYNNYGRQTGTAETVKKRVLTFPKGKYSIIRNEGVKHIGVYDMGLKSDDGYACLYMDKASEYDYPSVITNGISTYTHSIYSEYNLGKTDCVIDVYAFEYKRKLVLRELGTKVLIILALKNGAYGQKWFNGGNTYSPAELVINKKGDETYIAIAANFGNTTSAPEATLSMDVNITVTEL